MSILEDFYDTLPEDVKELIEFENEVFSISFQNIEKILKTAEKYDKNWLSLLIRQSAKMNAFHYKEYGILYEKMLKNETFQKFSTFDDFGCYLYSIGVLTEDDFQNAPMYKKDPEEYENPIEKNSFWDIIQNDDIVSFVDYITKNNINLSDPDLDRSFELYIGCSFSCFDFAAYCGSINILKYCLINNYITIGYQKDSVAMRAVMGGSESVVELLHSLNFPLKSKCMSAFLHHHNHLGKWLIDTYEEKINEYYLPHTASHFYNEELFLYLLLVLKININVKEKSYQATSLMVYSEFNNIVMVKYLLSEGADATLTDYSGRTASNYAVSKEMRELLQQYL